MIWALTRPHILSKYRITSLVHNRFNDLYHMSTKVSVFDENSQCEYFQIQQTSSVDTKPLKCINIVLLITRNYTVYRFSKYTKNNLRQSKIYTYLGSAVDPKSWNRANKNKALTEYKKEITTVYIWYFYIPVFEFPLFTWIFLWLWKCMILFHVLMIFAIEIFILHKFCETIRLVWSVKNVFEFEFVRGFFR